MPGNIDIGGYFDKLTRKAQGGRRLESDSGPSPDEYDASSSTATGRSGSAPSGPAPSRSSGGGLKDILRDVLNKGKANAKRTTDRVRGRSAGPTPSPTTRTTSAREQLPPEGTVVVEYSPQEDGDPDPGEVVWTWVPFEEDPSQGKDRPVVVIGRRGSKLGGIPLTTKPDEHEAQIAIGSGDWDPKRRDSYARIWRMLDIDPVSTRREGSVLDRKRFELIVTAVDEYYDVRQAPAGRAGTTKRESDYDY